MSAGRLAPRRGARPLRARLAAALPLGALLLGAAATHPAVAAEPDPVAGLVGPGAATFAAALDAGEHDEAVRLARASEGPASRVLGAVAGLELHERPMWRALLHYERRPGGRTRSRIDAPHFFLSADGKRSPEAELDATLVAMFAPRASGARRLPAACRFVARRAWLAEVLGEDAASLPEPSCPEFEQYERYLDAETLTLVFPGSFPSSPGSAFGHTLLRIDRAGQEAEAKLLNMSVNFAAEVPEGAGGGALYALRGLTGAFKGQYRLMPYHVKLREYAQIENRDVWEYELALEREQVRRVLAHGYELLISHNDYYFLSENCSYQLLAMLDVAFPDDPLTDEFGLWTIPIDTIKVLRERGLIRAERWTPSTVMDVRAREAALSAAELERVHALAGGGAGEGGDVDTELVALEPPRRAAVLDLLIEHARFERLGGGGASATPSPRERRLLGVRARLPVRTGAPLIPAPPPVDVGHGTGRVAVGAERGDDAAIATLGFRPAYHDLRDPSRGYGSRSTIDFGSLTLGLDDGGEAFVREAVIVGIESLEPVTTLVRPLSWRARISTGRRRADAPHRTALEVGTGYAVQPGAGAPVGFAFAEMDVRDDTGFDERYGLGLGVRAGLHWDAATGLRLGAEASHMESVGIDHGLSRATLWGSRAFGRDTAVVLDAGLRVRRGDARRRDGDGDDDRTEGHAAVELRRYF